MKFSIYFYKKIFNMISLKEALVRKNRGVDIDELKRDEILKFLNNNYVIHHH